MKTCMLINLTYFAYLLHLITNWITEQVNTFCVDEVVYRFNYFFAIKYVDRAKQ